jgi:predicted Zn-dependent protease
MTHRFTAIVRRRGILLSVLVPLLLAGCAVEPITGRRTFALLSEGEANTMGAQAYQQLMGEAKLGGTAAENALVLGVGRRIAKVTDTRLASEGREVYQWEFKVIDDPQTANAFALPGGKVAVYTGILPITKDENGLAVVLAHEIAHAYAQHGKKRMSEQVLSKVSLETVQTALGGDQASETRWASSFPSRVGTSPRPTISVSSSWRRRATIRAGRWTSGSA